MAAQIRTNLDFNNNQAIELKLEVLSSDPGSPQEGRFWYNSTSKKVKFFDGTSNQELPGAGGLTDPLTLKGVIDASTNPNYPAADAGDIYVISVAGLIGGASGVAVDVGDQLLCLTDATSAGDHATVGANWNITQANTFLASTTVAGIVLLSTDAKTQTGVDTESAVTPAGLASVGYTKKYATDISASSGATITAATHGLGATKALIVRLYEDGAPNVEIFADDISVADNGDVTWATTSAITGHIVIIG